MLLFHESLQYIVFSANVASAVLMPLMIGFGIRTLHRAAQYYKRNNV